MDPCSLLDAMFKWFGPSGFQTQRFELKVMMLGEVSLWLPSGIGCSAIAGCHCRVPFYCAMVGGTTNFGGVDVVPLLGSIARCQSLFHIFFRNSGPPISSRHTKKTTMNFS